ncbi:MAG: hypothetical protein JWM80_6540 [Cyanobacteria bacterium RYN_339]|nr:hypothetical protein [Cyanobacteria bacterium RYN_339]
MLRPLGSVWGQPTPSPTRPKPTTPRAPRADAAPSPAAPREFRAAWVATVQNIDWPSQPGMTADQQKAELVAIMDKAAATGLNALVLQVRPNCDALYASPYEPWSKVLTGQMGKDPGYDPLAFAVDEAHKRGLQLHAWFNPFRAGQPGDVPSAEHVSRKHPEWVKHYGGQLWLDPGNPQVQGYAQQVLMDVVRRYDIDAVHMDDYFYPYKISENGHEVDFPDATSYKAYKDGGGTLELADWRRDNVNRFVLGLSTLIHMEKPKVSFGISPFGIWKPGNPPGTTGLNQFEQLYADARLWLQKGWVDYFAPQLYWPIDKPAQSFPKLLEWWTQQNPLNRHVYAGMYTSAVMEGKWPVNEITRQIEATRKQPGAEGEIHFSMKPILTGAKGVDKALEASYAAPALVPASPWLDAEPPAAPEATLTTNPTTNRKTLTWKPQDEADVFRWAVYTQAQDGSWQTQIFPASKRTLLLGADAKAIEIAAVDRTGNESTRVRVEG